MSNNTPKEIYIYVGKNHVSNHWTSERFDEDTDIKYLSEESVNEMLAEKDKEIESLKSDVNKLNLTLYQNELNFNKICNCIHKGKSTSALCTGMCNR